jgi:hypothetical protein
LTKYLFEIGATKEEVDRVNQSLNKMLEAAEIKQEDMTDTISLLRKFEMKFNDLCEFRERETEGGTGGRYAEIKEIEDDLAKLRKEAKQRKKMADEKDKQDMNRLKMEEKAKKRD